MKKIYSSIAVKAVVAGLALSSVSTISAQSFEKEYYQKALWMTGRFYGAQRSGVGPNWLIADYEPTQVAESCKGNLGAFVKGQSFIKDSDGDYDLTGGWYDCGDFATFGQTFFYSAYMLVLGYSEFPEGYDDLYSFDYHGYINASDYTWEGKKGVPDGIPDILNEVKYATDFIIKAFRDSKTFYFQKGDGGPDHEVWCTSPTKSTLSRAQGGEADGPRHFEVAKGGETSMACLGGAALATMARVYKKFDPAYAAQCLEKAKVAYAYVTGTSKGNLNNCGFYGPKPKYITDEIIFYSELYRATNDEQYLKAAEACCDWMVEKKNYNYNYSLCYNNTEDLACYLIATFGDKTKYGENAMTVLDFYINQMYKPASGYFLNKAVSEAWGVLRFPANQAFVHGLYNKLKGDTKLNPYTAETIDYILGKNSRNYSFVVGLGDKFPLYPHHRNFYRVDNNDENALPKLDASYKYVQLGYLVGGSMNAETYSDNEKTYTSSEGGIDYNAGLVGALGYINSVLSPVDINRFGHPSPALGPDRSICGESSLVLDSKIPADGKKTFTWSKDGKQLVSDTKSSTYEITEAGVYTCVVDSAGDWETSASVTILDELPDVHLESGMLCNPATITLDATVDIKGVSYQWGVDGDDIEGANSSTYTATKAGMYTCKISATGCGSKKIETEITSNLPVVADAKSSNDGKITFTAEGDGDFEWYDKAEGGTLLGSGKSYTTTIDKDIVVYVQDAGSSSFVAGPDEKTFASLETSDWGETAALFTAHKPFMITGVSVYLSAIHTKGSQSITLTLTHNDKEQKIASDSIDLQNPGWYTITLSNPIEISEKGDYSLSAKPVNGSIPFYANGKDYNTFANNGDVIEFTGCDKGEAKNKPFPAMINWQIQAGSGCARAVVHGKYSHDSATNIIDANENVCNLYPNPASDVLFVELLNGDVNASVQIMSIDGKLVLTEQIASDGANSVDIARLANGIYTVIVNTESSRQAFRLIVKK